MPSCFRLALTLAMGLGVLGWMGGGRVRAQSPPIPSPSPPAAEPTIGEMQAQIAELQAMVRASVARQQQLEQRLSELIQAGGPAAPAANPAVGGARPAAPGAAGVSAEDRQEESLQSVAGVGRSTIDPTPSGVQMPAPPVNLPGRARFGPGFEIKSQDDEFIFQFHDLTQVDGRFYEQGGQRTTRDTFGLPRQWFIFSGQLTKPFEYYVAINQGFDNLALLDAFLNIHYDDRLQFKVGRYKTPFTYEFYGLPVNGLLTPERSQFFNNFALNRDVGLMAWGSFYDKKIDYAVGIFNGNPNSFVDADNSKNVAALVNFRPFAFLDAPALEFFNIGGSVDAGHELEPRVPPILRLNVPTSATAAIGVPFLAFREGVLSSGDLALWSLHMAWYYQQMSLIAEWQSGYESYAFNATPLDRTKNVTQSFYVGAGYFLTGETVSARGQVKPLRPFDIRNGRREPGAIEPVFRYDYLDVGDGVFDGGFSDPRLWTDRVQSLDLGVNWYLSQYVKIYAGWQHSEFGKPVLFRTTPVEQFQLTSDLFWFRFQVYF